MRAKTHKQFMRDTSKYLAGKSADAREIIVDQIVEQSRLLSGSTDGSAAIGAGAFRVPVSVARRSAKRGAKRGAARASVKPRGRKRRTSKGATAR